jgi:ribonuclease E
LWHKIFGAPAEPIAEPVGMPVDDASAITEAQDERESQEDFGGGEIRSLSGEDVTAAPFVDEHVEGFSAAEQEGEPAERTRGRSRRRRRGGRGRKSSGGHREGRSAEPLVHEQGGDDQLDADFDDLSDDEDKLTDDESPMATETANGDADLNDSDNERAPSHSRALSAAQRAIPSWDDAIGFIVESNMQSRSQRPRPSRSDSRSGSRGRPRGGRRK